MIRENINSRLPCIDDESCDDNDDDTESNMFRQHTDGKQSSQIDQE